MSKLQIRLFGKFAAESNKLTLKGLDGSKDQELLSYLLIHQNQPHSRESLAALLWCDTSTERSKKYLRQALWHLQSALESNSEPQGFLLIEHDWLKLNPTNRPWCDVEEFENGSSFAKGISGRQLDAQCARALKTAVELYQGDLLAGWYQDWVLFERERLQNKYLLMLDKLIGYSEQHREYELGQSYAATILKYDPARERTHRQLMKLHYLAGDRTAAIRQYERCVNSLRQELGVKPERRTVNLYERIKSDQLGTYELENPPPSVKTNRSPQPDVVGRLRQLQALLTAVQRRIQRDIRAVEASPHAEKEKL